MKKRYLIPAAALAVALAGCGSEPEGLTGDWEDWQPVIAPDEPVTAPTEQDVVDLAWQSLDALDRIEICRAYKQNPGKALTDVSHMAYELGLDEYSIPMMDAVIAYC